MSAQGAREGGVKENRQRRAAWTAGFSLLEVLGATAFLGVLLATVLGAVASLSRLDRAVLDRARVETAASVVLYSILQGSPERPGVVAATELLAVEEGRLKFKAKVDKQDVVYEYMHDRTSQQLRLQAGSGAPAPVLDGVEEFTARRVPRDDRVAIRVELTLRVPTPNGVTNWRVAGEGVPRNGAI